MTRLLVLTFLCATCGCDSYDTGGVLGYNWSVQVRCTNPDTEYRLPPRESVELESGWICDYDAPERVARGDGEQLTVYCEGGDEYAGVATKCVGGATSSTALFLLPHRAESERDCGVTVTCEMR